MAIQPPQRFELDDLAHVEREARTIYAPGAAPGDVLVVQSDHSLVAAPGGGSQPFKFARVKLNDAQIKALPTTPVEVVAAPGPGLMLWPFGALWLCDTTGGAYTNLSGPGDLLGLFHAGGGQGDLLSALIDGTNILGVGSLLAAGGTASASSAGLSATDFTPNNAGDVATISNPATSFAQSGAGEPWDDLALVVAAANSDGDYTGGDAANSLVIAVVYALVAL